MKRQVWNVPFTSLPLVEAWLPVTLVFRRVTLPPTTRSSPPPNPEPNVMIKTPGAPGVAIPFWPPSAPKPPLAAPPGPA